MQPSENIEGKPNPDFIIDQILQRFEPDSVEWRLITYLKDYPMQPDRLKDLVPEYRRFRAIELPSAAGLVFMKKHRIPEIRQDACQHFFAVLGGSGSGQTSVTEKLIERFPEEVVRIPTVTTRAPQSVRPDERNFTETEIAPGIMAKRTEHYFHVSRTDFDRLLKQHLFIESNKKPWTDPTGNPFFYGTYRPLFEQVFHGQHPNSLTVVDFDGARRVIPFVKKKHPDIQAHAVFILPRITMTQLAGRLLSSRPVNEVPDKLDDALRDTIRAARDCDIILVNPPEANGPRASVTAFHELMQWMHHL